MIGTFLCSFAACVVAHADRVDEALVMHFAVGTTPISEGSWRDFSGNVIARIEGSPVVGRRGPTDALIFTGREKCVVEESITGSAIALPKRAITAEAWVQLDATEEYGGIVSRVQDNGGEERGWVLGYDREHFYFALSTTGADDGDGKMTYLRGKHAIRVGAWHHVVGTYDGNTMRLYVDGLLDGESGEQSGEILHPDDAEFVVGGYVDRDESTLMDGGIFEAKVYGRAVSGQEIALAAAAGSNLLLWEPAEEELSFLVAPILQFGTLDSMTIVCETTRPTRIEVRYDEFGLLMQKASTAELSAISELTLTGLKPHTRYFYRVDATDESGTIVRSEVRSFQTAPPADRAWAFAILGDTQRNPTVTRKCAEGAFALRPNFLLHCGDLVDDGFAKNQWLKDLFEPCAELMAYVPTFPVIGNHEKDSHWYYDYFSLPKPEYYYTFHYGNAQFFMLDSNRPLKPGSEQYKWLEKELSASTATWKFAAHHHPCYSSDVDDYGDHLRGRSIVGFQYGDANAKQALALYEKYGVDIVFNGHIHVYERTWPILNLSINMAKGVRHITSGGGGGNLEHPAPQRTWFSLHVNRAHHHCHAVVFDKTMQFKAYDIEGRLFDTFELEKDD